MHALRGRRVQPAVFGLFFALTTAVAQEVRPGLFGVDWNASPAALQAQDVELTRDPEAKLPNGHYAVYETEALPRNLSVASDYRLTFFDDRLVRLEMRGSRAFGEGAQRKAQEGYAGVRKALVERFGEPEQANESILEARFPTAEAYFQCLDTPGCGQAVAAWKLPHTFLVLQLTGGRQGFGRVLLVAEAYPEYQAAQASSAAPVAPKATPQPDAEGAAFFGLRWEDTPTALRERGLDLHRWRHEGDLTVYWSRTVPEPLGAIDRYYLFFYKDRLLRIITDGPEIKDDPTGELGRERYNEWKARLAEHYAAPGSGMEASGIKGYRDPAQFYRCLDLPGCGLWYTEYEFPDKTVMLALTGDEKNVGDVTVEVTSSRYAKAMAENAKGNAQRDAQAF